MCVMKVWFCYKTTILISHISCCWAVKMLKSLASPVSTPSDKEIQLGLVFCLVRVLSFPFGFALVSIFPNENLWVHVQEQSRKILVQKRMGIQILASVE